MTSRKARPFALAAALAAALAHVGTGCATLPTMATVDHVDLSRFVGDWFVIAHIPASSEKDAYGAVESYRIDTDGTIATTYTFRAGSFDGEKKVHTSRGFVRNRKTNAAWGMQSVWPFKAEYLIVYLDEDYTQAIIGRSARDLVWILARKPTLEEADYQRLVEEVRGLGYDVTSLRRVPQRVP